MLELLVLLWVGLLLVVHEAGHLVAGLILKARVETVSIGLGPGLSFRRYGIDWKIGIVLVGAAVHFHEEGFRQVHPAKRILITLAGPLANLVAAVMCVSILRGEDMGYWAAALHAVSVTGQVLEQTGRALILLDVQRFHGPVNIAVQAQEAFRGGWREVIIFSAVGHYGIFALNMLPLPVLDGGRVAMALYEIVTGRSLPEQVRKTALIMSAAFLVLLLLAVTMKDIGQIMAK